MLLLTFKPQWSKAMSKEDKHNAKKRKPFINSLAKENKNTHLKTLVKDELKKEQLREIRDELKEIKESLKELTKVRQLLEGVWGGIQPHSFGVQQVKKMWKKK